MQEAAQKQSSSSPAKKAGTKKSEAATEQATKKEAEEEAKKQQKAPVKVASKHPLLDTKAPQAKKQKGAAKPSAVKPAAHKQESVAATIPVAVAATTTDHPAEAASIAQHLTTIPGESLAISILPTTSWEEIVPERSYLAELRSNPLIGQCCSKVGRIAADVQAKSEELRFVDEAEPLVDAIGDEDALHAIVAYTHDLQQPARAGNLYYEMNAQLRDRSGDGRQALMQTWGVCVHYTLKALAQLPDYEGTCYRGFPAADKAGILAQYKKGRPIQWGAFTSTTTDFAAAQRFAGQGGVIFKLDVTSGKDICPISFFHTEREILLSPNHKFVVTSETGGYKQGGHMMVDLMQMEGVWFVS